MAQRMTVEWNLRQLMATRGLYQTTDLVPLLADRGVSLSREQVFRLVTQPPQRLSMDTLAALCAILECGVEELITVVPAAGERRSTKAAAGHDAPQVRRTIIRRPTGM
jgi:DNA-binding Xre family transcriptional regulator